MAQLRRRPDRSGSRYDVERHAPFHTIRAIVGLLSFSSHQRACQYMTPHLMWQQARQSRFACGDRRTMESVSQALILRSIRWAGRLHDGYLGIRLPRTVNDTDKTYPDVGSAETASAGSVLLLVCSAKASGRSVTASRICVANWDSTTHVHCLVTSWGYQPCSTPAFGRVMPRLPEATRVRNEMMVIEFDATPSVSPLKP